VIKVPVESALHGTDALRVAEVVTDASLLALSVGKNALSQVIPLIASGIRKRYEKNPSLPLDIIIAENMRDSAVKMREWFSQLLPGDYPNDRLLGLVETSIGKMVPIIPESIARKDPLKVFAEPYNELILDETAFKGRIPDVKELALKSNIKAWVDRKAFVHNLGHATAAYKGAYHHPLAKYIYEVLLDKQVYNFTRAVMMQASQILVAHYPEDFTIRDLEEHIDDLLIRFQNRALGDTIFRVGYDLERKLGPEDRFMGIIRMAEQSGIDDSCILNAMAYGFMFRGKDEFGQMYPADVTFARNLSSSLNQTLSTVCGLKAGKDDKKIVMCRNYIEKLRV